jgi:hypothetical protein
MVLRYWLISLGYDGPLGAHLALEMAQPHWSVDASIHLDPLGFSGGFSAHAWPWEHRPFSLGVGGDLRVAPVGWTVLMAPTADFRYQHGMLVLGTRLGAGVLVGTGPAPSSGWQSIGGVMEVYGGIRWP